MTDTERRIEMTDTEKNRIDELRDRQPFRVPEGYFEGFTEDFMCRLPKRIATETKVVSFYERVKPWLYMAAMFAGIIILFNVISKSSGTAKDTVQSSIHVGLESEDDAEYLEYIEDMYASAKINDFSDYFD